MAFDALHPPDPCKPPPDDGAPPDPCTPPLVDDALRFALDEVVLTADNTLADRIETYLDSSASCDESCDRAYGDCLSSGVSRETCEAERRACVDECLRAE